MRQNLKPSLQPTRYVQCPPYFFSCVLMMNYCLSILSIHPLLFSQSFHPNSTFCRNDTPNPSRTPPPTGDLSPKPTSIGSPPFPTCRKDPSRTVPYLGFSTESSTHATTPWIVGVSPLTIGAIKLPFFGRVTNQAM